MTLSPASVIIPTGRRIPLRCVKGSVFLKEKGITGSTLKIVALVAMTLDHVAWGIIDPLLVRAGVSTENFFSPLYSISVSPVMCVTSFVFHTVGRITFPVMLFLLVEGFFHTSSLKKYIRNMAVFALLSELPFNLAFSNKLLSSGSNVPYLEGQNVFVTLTLSLVMLAAVNYLTETQKLPAFLGAAGVIGTAALSFSVSFFPVAKTAAAFGFKANIISVSVCAFAVFLILLMLIRRADSDKRAGISLSMLVILIFAAISYVLESDYCFTGVVAAALMYFLRKNKTAEYAAGCAYLLSCSFSEAGTVLGLPLVAAYNGKRGLKLKYVFYIYYPAHLLVIWAVRAIMKI